MRGPPAPLRFLVAVAAGWTLLRAAALAPLWPPEAGMASPAPSRVVTAPSAPALSSLPAAASAPPERAAPAIEKFSASAARPANRLLAAPAGAPIPADMLAVAALPSVATTPAAAASLRPPLSPHAVRASRWSGHIWAFAREGGRQALAPGSLLGGSQAGLRISYRFAGSSAAPLSVSARLMASPRRPQAAEAAVGLDWRPSRRLPVHLVAERRQKLGREGRSGLALSAYGGVSDEKLGAFRIDAWGEAGAVGARSRDLFADGSVRLSLPVGRRLRVGAGAWGATQPGVSRFDAGPQASFRIDGAGRTVTLAAEWRFRLAGHARPGSGPALTVASGF